MLPTQPNESLIDGLECLQALAVSTAPVGVRELARRLGLEPTRVHRLLKTLAHLGVAAQTPDSKYVPGPGMHVLAAQSLFASGLVRRALPVLESLQEHGLIVALGVLWKDQVSYLYHAEPGMSADKALGRIGLYPAACSSIGIALLAQSTDSEIRNIFKGKDIPGHAGIGALLEKIRETRKNSFGEIQNAADAASRSIAVCIGSPAYSAVAMSGKMTEKEKKEFINILRDAALKL